MTRIISLKLHVPISDRLKRNNKNNVVQLDKHYHVDRLKRCEKRIQWLLRKANPETEA